MSFSFNVYVERISLLKIDLSLNNVDLYAGLDVVEVAGRLNLKTPVDEAVNVIGKNIAKIVDGVPSTERDEVTLTGPMAVWAYLVVFHAVVHCFTTVKYSDGRGNDIVLSQHG